MVVVMCMGYATVVAILLSLLVGDVIFHRCSSCGCFCRFSLESFVQKFVKKTVISVREMCGQSIDVVNGTASM